MHDLNEEFQERALLANSKIFFKRNPSRFIGSKSCDKTKYLNVVKLVIFVKDCFSKTSLASYPSKKKLITSDQTYSNSQSEIRVQKYFKAKYEKAKAKLALLTSNGSTFYFIPSKKQGSCS